MDNVNIFVQWAIEFFSLRGKEKSSRKNNDFNKLRNVLNPALNYANFYLRKKEVFMHIDEQKRFDVRNIQRNIKNGVIAQKDYEILLSKLPDVSDKIFSPEESLDESRDNESRKNEESQSKKKDVKKRVKGKAK